MRRLILAADEPAAGTPAVLFAWDTAGEPAFAAVGQLPAGGVLELGDRLVDPPAAVTFSDGTDVVLVASADGLLRALTVEPDGLDELFTITAADSLVAGPQPVPLPGGEVLTCVVDHEGYARLYDENGLARGVPAELDAYEQPNELIAPLRVAVTGDYTKLLFVTRAHVRYNAVDEDGFAPSYTYWEPQLDGPAPLALLPAGDGDGELLLVFGPEGLQTAQHLPASGGNRPMEWPDPGAAVVGDPAVADLDGDGHLDVIAATSRRLFAWQDDGISLAGFPNHLENLFPLPDTTTVASPLVVADLAGGPGLELAVATEQGHLFVISGQGRVVDGTPFRFGDAGGAGLAMVPLASDRVSLLLAHRGGTRSEPLDRRLTHGRVALYDERVITGGEPATAAWFGPGGGPARTGWVGQARVVPGESPADQAAEAAIFYPNPLTDTALTVRFWSATDHQAEVAVYNLEGELVLREQFTAEADRINEHTVDLDVASGLYLARLTAETVAGQVGTEVRTVAVAR
jgi:hypothetical protein